MLANIQRNQISHICWQEYKMVQSLWKVSGGFYRIKHIPHNPEFLGTSWQRNTNVCPHKNLYMTIHSSFIGNSQKLGTTKIVRLRTVSDVDKPSEVHPYYIILLSTKKGVNY